MGAAAERFILCDGRRDEWCEESFGVDSRGQSPAGHLRSAVAHG